MLITKTSMITGIVHQMRIPCTSEQLAAYEAGMLLQEAFPNLTPDEREFIKTGIPPHEWNALFGGDEEEGEE